MIDLPLYDETGKQTGTVPFDESLFGGRVRPRLLKQAVVMYQAALHQGTAGTRSRGQVSGSTKKLYRQKGTGNARMGTRRTVIRRGGGVAFAKVARDMGKRMPKKMRRLARDNAILAKAGANEASVIEKFSFESPKTSKMAGLLKALDAERGCLLTLADYDTNVWKSSRNIPKTEVCVVDQLNAYSVLRRRKLVFTKEAYDRLMAGAAEKSGLAGTGA